MGWCLVALRVEDQLCFALYAATNSIVRAYRPLLRRIGLTYPQYLAMMVLWQDGERTIGQIAARLGLPAHGLTPLLERLESAGFVRRRRDPADRRAVIVSLTRSGAELEGAAARAQRTVACATGLAPDALAELREELHALTRDLDSGIAETIEGQAS